MVLSNALRIDCYFLYFLGGFYTVKASHYLRVIVLNTVLFYKPNKKVPPDGDPAGQFRWLVDTLQAARKDQEKVTPICFLSKKILIIRGSLNI